MSTTHKHTPGPWQYAKGHAPHFQTVVWPEGDGRAIATCYDDETEANARLIATAPELLAALEAVIAYMDAGNWADHRIDRMRMNARAAISKAKGE